MSDLNLNNPAPTTTPAATELAELKSACAQLQAETFNLRLILLIVVASLTLFFWREGGQYGFEVSQLQPQMTQANQLLEAISKQDSTLEKQIQLLQGVVVRLGEYAKVHPDYAQIMAKYGLVATAPATAAPAPAKPGATPAAPKK